MNKAEKLSLVVTFESAIEPLVELVKRSPAAAVDFRPDLPEAWTIRDHAGHFLDADTFAYTRLRLAVTQPGSEVFVWDEHAFRERGQYQAADALACLEAARALRHMVGAMARSLVDADWETFYVRHAVRGRLTLADLFKFYTDHAQFHLGYLRRNLEAFYKASAA